MPRSWRYYAAAVAGAAICAAAVSWLFVVHLGATPSQRLVDLDVYRGAARALLDGRDLYSFHGHAPQRLPFTYPPFAALVATPLAVIPAVTVGWIWSVGEVLTTIAETTLAHQARGERGVLKLYERWLRSGSSTLATELGARGIVPVRGQGGLH